MYKISKNTSQLKGENLPDSFWDKYVKMCQRLEVNPYAMAAVLESESGFDPTATNYQYNPKTHKKEPAAKGLHQLIPSTAESFGIDYQHWLHLDEIPAEDQLIYVERYFKGKTKGKSAAGLHSLLSGGYNNPDGSLYANFAAQKKWINSHPQDKGKFKNPIHQNNAVEQNKQISEDGKITLKTLEKFHKNKPSPGIKRKITEAISRLGFQNKIVPEYPSEDSILFNQNKPTEESKPIEKTNDSVLDFFINFLNSFDLKFANNNFNIIKISGYDYDSCLEFSRILSDSLLEDYNLFSIAFTDGKAIELEIKDNVNIDLTNHVINVKSAFNKYTGNKYNINAHLFMNKTSSYKEVSIKDTLRVFEKFKKHGYVNVK